MLRHTLRISRMIVPGVVLCAGTTLGVGIVVPMYSANTHAAALMVPQVDDEIDIFDEVHNAVPTPTAPVTPVTPVTPTLAIPAAVDETDPFGGDGALNGDETSGEDVFGGGLGDPAPGIPGTAVTVPPTSRTPAAATPGAVSSQANVVLENFPAPKPIGSPVLRPWRGQVRELAPGVLRQIPAIVEPRDAAFRYDLVLPELVGKDGDLSKDVSWMKDVPLMRTSQSGLPPQELWMLEFRFKPVGIMDVDIPQPDGRLQSRKVWYLVYSVKNTGNVVVPQQDQKDLTWTLVPSAKSVRFFPRFALESTLTQRMASGEYETVQKLYQDQIIPVAAEAIQNREGTRQRLLNTVDAVSEIAPGEEVWGVVVWDAVDPKTRQFSIYVQGLTNAYLWKQKTGADGSVDPEDGTPYRRTLKLNFLRRGDQYMVRENQILYGVGAPGGLDHEWVYR